MKQTKHFKRLWSLMLLLIAMLMPQGAWATPGILYTGTQGTCTWIIYEDGDMVVSPTEGSTGDLGTWERSKYPSWNTAQTRPVVKTVRFTGSITAQQNFERAFCDFSNATSIDLTNLSTEKATRMPLLFSGCKNLVSLNLANLKTDKATILNQMFYDCSKLTSLDLSKFNTQDAIAMTSLFYNCQSLQSLTLGNFDMQKVTDRANMFDRCPNLKTLTLKSLPYLADGTFNSQFTGDGVTVNYILDENSVIYEGENHLPAATSCVVKNYDREGNEIELAQDSEGNFTAADISIADGKAFSTPVAFTTSNVTMARTFTAEKPASVMLPFSVPADQVSGAKFYAFSGVTYNESSQKWEAKMTQVTTGNLKAYKPYLVILDPEATGITFGSTTESATFPVTPTSATDMEESATGWTFKAVNSAKSWAADDEELGRAYGFAAADHESEGFTEGQFVKVDAGASAAPGRCYLLKDTADPLTRAGEELPASIGIRFVVGSTTGIGTLDTETGAFTFDGWYDLQGNRVSDPMQGGVMIKNNKKVMVK